VQDDDRLTITRQESSPLETTASMQDDVGLVGRMVRVFYAPAETFEAVQQRHSYLDWLVPVLLVALVGAGTQYMTMPILQKMQAKAVAEMAAKQDMTPEQAANQRQVMEKMSGVTNVVTLVMVPVMTFIMLFIFAGVLLLVGRFALGGELTYGQMLALEAYAMLITVPQNIVLTPIRQARESMMVTLGPGLLLGQDMLETYVGRVINGIDIFMIWQVVVIGIGLSILARAGLGKTMGILFSIWVLFLAGGAALRGLFPGM
jgi:hypothetical protein